MASARAALLGGEPAAARWLVAADGWAELGAPYEAAVARVVAGDALAALANRPAASLEWEAARRMFSAYGAAMS